MVRTKRTPSGAAAKQKRKPDNGHVIFTGAFQRGSTPSNSIHVPINTGENSGAAAHVFFAGQVKALAEQLGAARDDNELLKAGFRPTAKTKALQTKITGLEFETGYQKKIIYGLEGQVDKMARDIQRLEAELASARAVVSAPNPTKMAFI